MNQLMWQVPPIQFVVNDAAAETWEIEERLKAADMGPDFEPTPFGNNLKQQPSPAQEQMMTDISCRSDVENLSVLPGPGGSTELVMSKTVDHEQNFAQHSDSWNASCEDALPLHSAEESADEQLDNENIIYMNVMSSESESLAAHKSARKDRHSHKSKNVEAECSSTSEFRSDIFGLDHAGLWNQVLHAKRKSENRSYKPSDEIIAQFCATSDRAKKDVTKDVVTGSRKMRKRRKSEQLCRNPDYLLSCHYHNNDEEN